MIQAFGSYIKTIAMLLVFSAFIQMVAPENHFKKFIGLIMGLVLIGVMIKPLSGILSQMNANGADRFVWSQYNIGQQVFALEKDFYETQQLALIIDTYKADLTAKTKTVLTNRFGLSENEILDVRVQVEENGESALFGSILLLEVILEEEDSSRAFLDAGAGRILFGNADNSSTGDQALFVQEIKNYLSDFYNLSADNIYITVQKKNGGENNG